jgi:hypothetical protein
MSYDVWIGDSSFNYTSNVFALFSDHIDGGLISLDGLTGKQASDRLAKAFEAIDNSRHALWKDNVQGEPAFCAQYDAKNGWGSTVGGIIFLAKIHAACAANPRKTLRVSA